MENQLETIKANLPAGYEKLIAAEVGCSQGTVHNILNSKKVAERSSYKNRVISAATRMAGENLQVMKCVADTAAELNNLNDHGVAS